MKSRFVLIAGWLLNRLKLVAARDRVSFIAFYLAFAVATMIAAILVALGNPIGSRFYLHFFEMVMAVGINGLLFASWTIAAAVLLSLLYIPVPRLVAGSFSYTIFVSIYILIKDDAGSLFSFIVGFYYSLAALLIGLLVLMVLRRKIMRVLRFSVAIFSFVFAFSFVYMFSDGMESYTGHGGIQAITANDTAPMMTAENPAEKGDYDYTFLTYGSGTDKQREEFGAKADLCTPTVDASHFITRWSDKREAFWGFDQSHLPVNGRLWIPDGKGPFPVILMVHGNHEMEDFSTSGYDYLGKLLASRGFITISVDEDFINYSSIAGSPNDNYKLRAWMLLQHEMELQEMNQTAGNKLYQKMDLDQVALLGHSRGGQAVSMAADFTTFFDDKELAESLNSIKIKAVAALAPTDYKKDGKRSNLHNVSYLLLQGARDGDINDFRGDRQYERTDFDRDDDSFKASLYIADANHSQFNTEWGRMDASLPKGLFLNRRQLMDPEDQRQIAKVYVSAFFEDVFHGESSYEDLFRSYRYGQDWLPDTTLVSQYENANYTPIIAFHHDQQVFGDGVTPVTSGFTQSKVVTPKDRRDHNLPVDAVRLDWGNEASYTIHSRNTDLERGLKDAENLVLTIANRKVAEKNDRPSKIQVELKTTGGVSVLLPLDDVTPLPPVIETEYTPFGLLDDIFRDGKYETSWEPIFQTFELPIEKFAEENPAFKIGKVNVITLHFSGKGKIMISGLGFE